VRILLRSVDIHLPDGVGDLFRRVGGTKGKAMKCPRCDAEWSAEDMAGMEVLQMHVELEDEEYALVKCPCGKVLRVYDADTADL